MYFLYDNNNNNNNNNCHSFARVQLVANAAYRSDFQTQKLPTRLFAKNSREDRQKNRHTQIAI